MREGECMYCELEEPLFVHHVYHKNNYLQLCTTCLLHLYPEDFCPICFQVYGTENLVSSPNHQQVTCHSCPTISHLSCVGSAIASSSTTISISIKCFQYTCPSCADPNFKFFNFYRDEKTKRVLIDEHLAQQFLAASIISQQSMKKAAILSRQYAEMKAVEAVQAQKEAIIGLENLAQLTSQAKNLENVQLVQNHDHIPSSSQSRKNKKRRPRKKRAKRRA